MVAPQEHRVGEVSGYRDSVQSIDVDLEAPVHIGDLLHVVGPRDDFRFRVTSMLRGDEEVAEGEPGDQVRLLVPFVAHTGSEVWAEERPMSLTQRILGRVSSG